MRWRVVLGSQHCLKVSVLLLLLLLLLLLTYRIVITEAPGQLINQSTGTRHMLLTWPIVPATSCPPYPISYTILYQSIEPETNTMRELELQSIPENQIGSGHMYVVLSGLEEFYLYNVTLFASNKNGNGPIISSLFRTLPTGTLLFVCLLLFTQ